MAITKPSKNDKDIKTISEKLKTTPNIIKSRKEENGNESRVFMFFSVDLVNSTQYKSERKEWASVIKNFYDIIISSVKNKYPDAQIWKYAGDEVLFYIEISKLDEIIKAPESLHLAMTIAQNEFYSECKGTENFLYLKGALWLAATTSQDSVDCGEVSNIYIALPKGWDFIGVQY